MIGRQGKVGWIFGRDRAGKDHFSGSRIKPVYIYPLALSGGIGTDKKEIFLCGDEKWDEKAEENGEYAHDAI